MKLLNLSMKNFIALKQKNFKDETNFFMHSFWCETVKYVKLVISLNEMEELKKFQSLTFDTIARRRSVEDQDTILALTGKIQELQMKLIVWTFLRTSRFLNQSAVEIHTLPVNQCFLPHRSPGGMLRRSIGMPSRREGPPSIWETHGISGNVLANPVASSFSPYPQELNPWSSE